MKKKSGPYLNDSEQKRWQKKVIMDEYRDKPEKHQSGYIWAAGSWEGYKSYRN